MERIGLIAGAGRLPIIFAKEARKKGAKVIGFAIKEMASPDFNDACDRVHWLGPGQVKKLLFLLIAERIKKIAMLGKVDKSIIYGNLIKKDKEISDFFKSSKDKKDYTILDEITSEFQKRGIEVISGIEYLADLLPAKGVLTKREPSEKERDDIFFGFKIAKEIAGSDVGQTVIVKNKAVISVEAMEGTNQTIKRAAKLCPEGFSVIKVARPNQDMRWDVPAVGPETVELIARSKGKVLAIEEKKTFLVEKASCVKMADENDISIVVV